MPRFFNRVWELFVSDRYRPFIAETTGRQFKIVFNVLHDFGGFNSYAEIVLYGLSKSTESKILKKGEYIALRAGYVDAIDYIFMGEIVNIVREKHLVRIICKGRPIGKKAKVINEQFAEGVTIPTLCRACARDMGLKIVIEDDDFPGQSPYLLGYLMIGDPVKHLNTLSKAHGFRWLLEGNRVVIIGKQSSRRGAAQIVSTSTGMVGVPELTEVGLNVSVKLSPSMKIGQIFRVESEFKQINYSNMYYQDVKKTVGEGEYKIHSLEVSGDSHGDAWDTRLVGYKKWN